MLALPPRAFFRHGVVRSARVRVDFTAAAAAELRHGGPAALRLFTHALANGELSAAQWEMLTPDAVARVRAMDAQERRQHAARIADTFFSARQRGGEHEPMLPPACFRQLSVEEQQWMLRLGPAERRNFVRRRFPALADGGGMVGGSGRVAVSAREFLAEFAALSAEQRTALLDEPLSRAVQAVVAARGAAPPKKPR